MHIVSTCSQYTTKDNVSSYNVSCYFLSPVDNY